MSNITDVTSISKESAKWDYENTPVSLKDLSDKYGKYPMYWSRLIKKEGWKKYSVVESYPTVQKEGEDNQEVEVRYVDELYLKYQAKHSGVAHRKAIEIVNMLGIHYSPIDEPMIMMFADLYEKYLILADIIKLSGDLTKNDKGVEYNNPRFNNYLAVMERMAKIGDRLGISVSSRKRMGIILGAKDERKSLFDLIEDINSDEDEEI